MRPHLPPAPAPPRPALAVVLATALLSLAAPARASAPPLGITVSGAVSLGSYEAGLLYYLVETLRLNPGLREVRVVTGTSAGSANGLLAILQHCGAPPGPPDGSLFWRSWVDVGVRQFHLPDRATALGAFSRDALDRQAERIEEAWRSGLRASCDVVLGISATRVSPRLVSMAPEHLHLPRIDEQFALRIQGRGPGSPPRLTNYVDPTWPGDQLMLPEDTSGEVAFSALRDLLLASLAFPGAFEPKPLAHCVATTRDGNGTPRCPAGEAVTEPFLDGALLDNTPLRFAVRLARAGLRDDPGAGSRWSGAPRFGEGEPPRTTLFAYVSPTVIGYPGEEAPPRAASRPEMLDHLSRLAGSFVDAALARNLLTLLEDDPSIGHRVAVPVRSLPAAGSPLVAFFGFFEEEFRRFDFQLGMYEARRMLAGPGAGRWRATVLPEESAPGAAWRPLACLRAVVDGAGDAQAACGGDDLADFRILLRVSLERLWDRCARGDGPAGPDQPAGSSAAGRS